MPMQSPGTWTAGWAMLEKNEIMLVQMEPLVVKVRGQVNVLCSMKMEAWRSSGVFWMDSWNTKGLFMQHTQRPLIPLYISQLMEQQTFSKQERFSQTEYTVIITESRRERNKVHCLSSGDRFCW